MSDRTRRYRLGRYAESISVWHLRLRGYRVLDRRYRTPVGEIDIIAQRGNLIAFIEVKARRTKTLAIESITPKQRHRIRRAAGAHVKDHHPRFAFVLNASFNTMRWQRKVRHEQYLSKQKAMRATKKAVIPATNYRAKMDTRTNA